MDILSSKGEGSIFGALKEHGPKVLIAVIVAVIGMSLLGPAFGLIAAGLVIFALYHKTIEGKVLGIVTMFSGGLALVGSAGAL